MSAPPGKGGKGELATALQLGHRLPRLGFLSALMVTGTLGVVGVWPALTHAGRETATAGPVSNHHRLIENECQSCHSKPFHGAPDNGCTACHKVHEHAAAMPRLDRRMHCASCHKEHHGLRSLVPDDSPLCTSCHAHLDAIVAGTREPPIGSFARHPEFGFMTRTPPDAGAAPTAGPHDATPLKFSHAEHLQAHPGTPHPDALICSSCHEPTPDQTIMAPISFEERCEPCHELKLDARLKGLHVPHGSSDLALEAIRAELSRAYVGLAPPLSAPGASLQEPGGGAIPSQDAIAAEALDLEQGLYSDNSGCVKCHDVVDVPPAPGKSRHAVVAPQIPEGWLPRSKFSHGAHRTTPCRGCHVAAEHSTTAGDVLLPGIARCRECHADPGVAGKIESPCLECHRYHAAK